MRRPVLFKGFGQLSQPSSLQDIAKVSLYVTKKALSTLETDSKPELFQYLKTWEVVGTTSLNSGIIFLKLYQ